MNEEELIEKTREFVKQSFVDNPHYSFGHWSVMYNHSCKVEEIARQIAQTVECDTLLVSIGALLHDIGKTHKADEETLHRDHGLFNLNQSEHFLDDIGLDADRLKQLKEIVAFASESPEIKVIKDADTLALAADKTLYRLYIKWAHAEKLEDSIERKLKKFENPVFR